jgi:hypothetical protein
MSSLLDNVNSPADIKALTSKELEVLAQEIRTEYSALSPPMEGIWLQALEQLSLLWPFIAFSTVCR